MRETDQEINNGEREGRQEDREIESHSKTGTLGLTWQQMAGAPEQKR